MKNQVPKVIRDAVREELVKKQDKLVSLQSDLKLAADHLKTAQKVHDLALSKVRLLERQMEELAEFLDFTEDLQGSSSSHQESHLAKESESNT